MFTHLVAIRCGPLCAGLLLLALWVQALAPIIALRMEAATTDPFHHAVICGQAIAATDNGNATEFPAPAMPNCGHCDLCCAGLTAPTLPAMTSSRAHFLGASSPGAKPSFGRRMLNVGCPPPITFQNETRQAALTRLRAEPL